MLRLDPHLSKNRRDAAPVKSKAQVPQRCERPGHPPGSQPLGRVNRNPEWNLIPRFLSLP